MTEPTTHTLEVPGAVLTHDATQNTVEEHADDLHRLISAIDAGHGTVRSLGHEEA
jgi:hypothetical protein